ncbi:MAG: 6-hydroxymethylpterin diphosphokinase MptE-like protein [Hydrogenovibrio sp.]
MAQPSKPSDKPSLFFKRFLFNLADCIHPVASLKASLSDQNAVVLGGGPSLDASLPWLKQHQSEIIIFAAGRISRRLLKESIRPDFITTIDPNEVIYDNSKEMVQFSDDTILLHTNYSYPTLITDWQGLKAYTEKFLPWEEPNPNNNLAVEGPTVTNSMIGLAHAMGCQNVYLLGVDFCYSSEGQTHESHSLDSQTGQISHDASLTLTTYEGRTALTNPVFAEAHRQLSHYIEALPAPYRVFNTASSAAEINGIDCIRHTRIPTNASPKSPLFHAIRKRLQDDESTLSAHFQTVRSALTPVRKSLQDIQKQAQAAIKALQQIEKQPEKQAKTLPKIDRMRVKIFQQDLALAILDHVSAGHPEQKNLILEPADHQNDPAKMLTVALKQMRTFEQLSRDLIHSFDLALKQVQIRQLALKGGALKKLAEHWQTHQEEGRLLAWLKHHQVTLADLPPADQALAQSLLKRFEARTQSHDAVRLGSKLASLKASTVDNTELAFRLFQSRDEDGLNKLIQRLQNSAPQATSDKNAATIEHQDTLQLARGYQCQLNNQFDQACAHYTQLSHPRQLELGLLQVFAIAEQQKNPATAINALAVLTHLNDDYRLIYAEMLEKNQQTDSALTAYKEAFKRQPSLETGVKWIQKLMAYHRHDAAQKALIEVISTYPEQAELTSLSQRLEAEKASRNTLS